MPNQLAFLVTLSLSVAVTLTQAAVPPMEGSLKDRFESCRQWKDKLVGPEQRKGAVKGQHDCTVAMQDAEKAMEVKDMSPEMAALILRIVDVTQTTPAEMTSWNRKARPLCRTAEPYFKAKNTDDSAKATYLAMCPVRAAKIFKK